MRRQTVRVDAVDHLVGLRVRGAGGPNQRFCTRSNAHRRFEGPRRDRQRPRLMRTPIRAGTGTAPPPDTTLRVFRCESGDFPGCSAGIAERDGGPSLGRALLPRLALSIAVVAEHGRRALRVGPRRPSTARVRLAVTETQHSQRSHAPIDDAGGLRLASPPCTMGEWSDDEVARGFTGAGPTMTFLPIWLWCVGCGPVMNVYGGTGLLQMSGSPNPELASQSLILSYCRGDAAGEPEPDGFTVLAIGEQCTVTGAGYVGGLRPDPDIVCTLVFPKGARTLRLTIVLASYGEANSDFGGTESARDPDTSTLDIRIEGDDIKNGSHAVYRFTGRALRAEPGDLCTRNRPRHESSIGGT